MTGRDFDRLIGDLKRTETTTEAVNRSAGGFGSRLGDLRPQLRNAALSAGVFTGAMGALGKSFIDDAVRMEGIRNGLIALEGSAEAAEARIASLREVFRQPGVGYVDAAKASVQLKSVNMEAELANRTIREVGNSLAIEARAINAGTGIPQLITEFEQYITQLDRVIAREEMLNQNRLVLRQNPAFNELFSSENARVEQSTQRRDQYQDLVDVLTKLANKSELTRAELENLEQFVGTGLAEARELGIASAIDAWDVALRHIQESLRSLEPVTERASANIVNQGLKLAELRAAADDAAEALTNLNSSNIGEIDTQDISVAFQTAMEAMRAYYDERIALVDAALSKEKEGSEAYQKLEVDRFKLVRETELAIRRLQEDSTRIIRDELSKESESRKRAAEIRIDRAMRAAEVESDLNRKASDDLQRLAGVLSQYRGDERQRIFSIVNAYRDHGESLDVAIQSTKNYLTLIDGVGRSLEKGSTLLRVTSGIINRDLNRGVRVAAELWKVWGDNIEASQEKLGRFEHAGFIADLQATGQILEDQGFLTLTATGQPSTTAVSEVPQVTDFQGRVFEQTGNIVANVPFDVVDAIANSVRLRRDGNAEILRLEQESAAEIKLIQESVTLSAENKASAIERIERQSALQRIRIENEVSERQRESFQSVVTNFLSGIARMIAAEAQLALARRATSALSSLFSGGAAAVGGAGLASGVLLPLVGGLGLAYVASQLISRSSPSAEVYQRSEYGAVSGSGAGTVPNVQPSRGTSRAEQEGGLPMLEANINVSVEASGTRLGQANAREQLKTERWGG